MKHWILILALALATWMASAGQPQKPTIADREWEASNKALATKPADVVCKAGPKVRVHAVESLHAKFWRLPAALENQFKDKFEYTWSFEKRPGYGQVKNQILGFPRNFAEVYDEDVYVVLGAAVGQGLQPLQRLALEQFVKDGGGLLICGGWWTFDSGGGWSGTVFDEMSPVVSATTNSLWERNLIFHPAAGTQGLLPGMTDFDKIYSREPAAQLPPSSPTGSPLEPAGKNAITDGLKWEAKPLVFVSNKVEKLKEGVTVLVTADGKPMVVTWKYGKGNVAAILATPLGEAAADKTAFWDWPDWSIFMGRLVASFLPAKVPR
ncbi:MAG TPA: hypothetical protein VGP72_27065 [Planctomycetota bacterium]|jgi:hypothetical protein